MTQRIYRATANDLFQSFTKPIDDQILSKIIQLSMGGLNINWKFYEHLTDSAQLDMLSCGLCVVHGAFQNGHKLVKMKVNVTLRRF